MPSSTLPSFSDLGLPAVLVTALERRGVTSPFPIQAATIPDALAGRDVLGRGQTGSGKTLAFGLPMLARLGGQTAAPRRPLAVVLVPTRELAMQVHDALMPLAQTLRLRTRVVVGGLSIGKQIDGLRRGVEIVIATPGRLTDLVERRACDLSAVRIAVLDEADHMADMGFLPVVSALLDQMPAGGQRLLFSATLDRDVDTVVRKYLVDAVTHSTAPSSASVTTMDHHVLLVAPRDKVAVATQIANRDGRTLLFVRTKHGADRLARQLEDAGIRVGALHGGKTQGARTKTLAAFKDGRLRVLVATDVAARGIHVDGIDLVLHVDPPADHKDYLHRAGRTARAGESGTVVTLVLPPQEREVDRMTQQAGVQPRRLRVSPGHDDLVAVTGARPAVVTGRVRADSVAGGAAPVRGRRPAEAGHYGGSAWGDRRQGRPGQGRAGRPGRPGRSGQSRHRRP
jgi:superfamily II DNA/RNA helicase